MDAYELIRLIKESKKRTPVVAYIKGDLSGIKSPETVKFFACDTFGIAFGDLNDVETFLEENKERIEDVHFEVKARNSALPLADLRKYEARIEPGAIIRDMVEIGRGAVIMMGAVINVGASIGENTMIDMNVVVGGRAIIGKNCHIGAGTVIAGVIEPPSANPVIIEDNVMVGANAVILEGVRVGAGAVVAAGAVVTKDVPPKTVVAGVPAKVIKQVDTKTLDKTQIVEDLRRLE
ncbi:MAG: tetrahydrodipicolinate N-acetyltransferase [Thermotogota bacterium]|nr:tetrahydrodipicolinate N-acetyltransferase [Thermotogota bacterium]MDK2864534.1 tetrahydrodipicolinate N-acetyltransferase [Thermotogota bacterium]HCZ06198.1 2,3,4,5-tetrahydropyridine-2,6-dicarboxylate N-acetyltransferase [Thermotogota bacterium]